MVKVGDAPRASQIQQSQIIAGVPTVKLPKVSADTLSSDSSSGSCCFSCCESIKNFFIAVFAGIGNFFKKCFSCFNRETKGAASKGLNSTGSTSPKAPASAAVEATAVLASEKTASSKSEPRI